MDFLKGAQRRKSLSLAHVYAHVKPRVGDMQHLDVEIAGGGGEEDEGEEEAFIFKWGCFVALLDVRCLIPLH